MSGNIGDKIKKELKNENNFKLVKELDGKRIRVLMDNKNSFKLIDPKTGKHIKVLMDNDKSFKLVTNPNAKKILMDNDKSFRLLNRNGETINFKLKDGSSFKLMVNNKTKSKKKKVSNEDKILELTDVKKEKKQRSKFETFFVEPSFNLLEMIVTIVLISSLLVFAVLWICRDNGVGPSSLNNPSNKYQTITDSSLTEFIDLYTDIVENYYEDINTDELLDVVTKAMIEYLGDNYTGFMNEYDARNLRDQLNGKYEGLGFEIATTKEDEKIVVIKVYEGSPAEKAGILAGDVIKSVNEVSVDGKNSGEISLLIKDKLTGTIKVVVDRDGEEKSFFVKKGTVIINSVHTELFGTTGYIKIDVFSNMAVNQVQSALSDLESKGMTSLVVDVRNNNGGYIDSAYNIADLFIPKNKVIYKLQTNKDVKTFKGTANNAKDYKVAVLINGGSASASEVFALAMRDSYGSLLIGSKSFGKGTVQETSELTSGSLVKYTIAKWLGPNGESINGKGIVPDIYADMGADYIKEQTYENDGQLQRAIKAVNE